MSKRPALTPKQWAILIFGMAFLIRLIYLLQIRSNPYFYSPMVDELWHLNWANDILTKSFWGTEIYFRAPLYPYLLALMLKITGSEYFWTRLVQMLFAAGSVSLLYLIAREYFSEPVARLASVFYAFYGTLMLYESMFLIEILFIFFNLLGLLILVRNRDNPSPKNYFWAGLIFGLSAITRPNILLVVPFWGLWILFHFRKKIATKALIVLLALFGAGVVLPIVPVTVRNYIVADDFVLISSQGGINLYLGNNPSAEGLTMIMPEIVLDARIPVSRFVPTISEYAEKEMKRPLRPSEVSAFWNKKAEKFILENPGKFIGLTFKKLVYYFSGFENPDQHDIYEFSKFSSLSSILIFDHGLKFPFGFFAPLGLVGLILCWKRRSELAPILIFFFAYIPTVIFFLVTARHRLTVIPILLLFAAYLIFYLWNLVERSRWKEIAVTSGATFILLILLNINFFDLGFHNVSQMHFNLGITYSRQGKYDEAIREYNLAAKETPGVPAIYHGLGTTYNLMKRYGEAAAEFQKALTLDPNYYDAIINLGLSYIELKQYDKAEQLFLRGLAIDSTRPESYINLGSLYMYKNDLEKSRMAYLRAVQMKPDDYVMLNKIGILFGRAGDSATAYDYFRRSAKINPTYAAGFLNWGNICMLSGDPGGAVDKYTAALKLDSTLIEPYYNLAVLFSKAGDKSRALDYVNRLLRIKPDFDKGIELKKQLSGQ
jgi:tetratricopeptide (TPR) repeat protein